MANKINSFNFQTDFFSPFDSSSFWPQRVAAASTLAQAPSIPQNGLGFHAPVKATRLLPPPSNGEGFYPPQSVLDKMDYDFLDKAIQAVVFANSELCLEKTPLLNPKSTKGASSPMPTICSKHSLEPKCDARSFKALPADLQEAFLSFLENGAQAPSFYNPQRWSNAYYEERQEEANAVHKLPYEIYDRLVKGQIPVLAFKEDSNLNSADWNYSFYVPCYATFNSELYLGGIEICLFQNKDKTGPAQAFHLYIRNFSRPSQRVMKMLDPHKRDQIETFTRDLAVRPTIFMAESPKVYRIVDESVPNRLLFVPKLET